MYFVILMLHTVFKTFAPSTCTIESTFVRHTYISNSNGDEDDKDDEDEDKADEEDGWLVMMGEIYGPRSLNECARRPCDSVLVC